MARSAGSFPRIQHDPSWFTTGSGDPVGLFTLRNSTGMEVSVSEWGATLVSVRVPPGWGTGVPREILLGWSRPDQWEENPAYLGSTVGRFANRVDRGRFELDGRPVELERNAPPHQLHGGPRGFSHRLWRGRALEDGASAVELHLRSAHGDQGWPGNLDIRVRYTLHDDNRLVTAYEARTDAPTHLNVTNHAYLNLAGVDDGPGADGTGPAPVHDHRLRLHASRFTPTDAAGIPTGQLRQVEGTPLDFTTARLLGDALASPSPLVAVHGGLDHNFVLDGNQDGSSRSSLRPAHPPTPPGDEARGPAESPGRAAPTTPGLRPCARVEHPPTGRVLEVATTCPGVQLYTANGLDEVAVRGGPYRPHAALCLETQFFPDTPNRPDFPSTRLDPGQAWRHTTTWRLLHLTGHGTT